MPETAAHRPTNDDLETAARDNLAAVLVPEVAPQELDLDADIVDEYGLTSLNKVLFLTSVCEDRGVDLSTFTEPDVAGLRTLRDVVVALAERAATGA